MGKPGTVLITGGQGQLARALSEATRAAGIAAVRVGRPAFDFEQPETLDALLAAHAPSVIVNAAAYTAVDAAETEQEAAFRANRDGPARLARLAAERAIPLIHISTDYVFDGAKGAPYVETDPVSPASLYGASKFAGEQAVLESGARAIVLRTSWVYAPQGRNFLLTMLNAARKTDRLRVVADQKGCPTAAADLARAIVVILAALRASGWQARYGGLFHAAGEGWTTWHGFARAIFRQAARHGLAEPLVEPIATADWPTPAHRPADSRLDCAKFAAAFGHRLAHWESALADTLASVFSEGGRT